MTLTTRPSVGQLVAEQRADQRRLEHLLDVLPICGHFPIDRHALTCIRCATHKRCDQIDRAIDALLRRAS